VWTGEKTVSGAYQRITDLDPGDEHQIARVAALLMAGFRERAPHAWPTTEAALEEVQESLAAGRISLLALDAEGAVLGWIGGRPTYDGHVWELHPLVVHPEHRRRGIGRALVAALEERIRARGALTLWLGTDDERDETTLAATDLYPDPLAHLARIQNLRDHPYEFYQKVGFVIVGVMPDANGWGKPDIYMAKPVPTTERGAGMRQVKDRQDREEARWHG
jgi:aminoglycoside 6'-N-acetyltransferase I